MVGCHLTFQCYRVIIALLERELGVAYLIIDLHPCVIIIFTHDINVNYNTFLINNHDTTNNI